MEETGSVNNPCRVEQLIQELYKIVGALGELYPVRHFTPDGHLVGSIGECLVAEAYGLTLEQASNRGFDACSAHGDKVEIKATQSNRVAFRSEPAHTIVIKIEQDGTFEEIFNGPGNLVWKQFEGKKRPGNGQYQISLSRLRRLNESVIELDRLPRKA
ncbi:MAG: hypothetical protein AVO35_12810 [Candidatus Aegiribacteria sp. MLS_C]|jgi:hypothetical protein|nr:MAG: hypothetical protein AVO35_12810 [Candidatus Aegiribacteria sp. MLS_C]